MIATVVRAEYIQPGEVDPNTGNDASPGMGGTSATRGTRMATAAPGATAGATTTSVAGAGGVAGATGTAGTAGTAAAGVNGTGAGAGGVNGTGVNATGVEAIVPAPKRLGKTPSCSAEIRDKTGRARTPTSAASQTRCRAPAVLRRRLNVARSAATSRRVAFARKSTNGPAPENGMLNGLMTVLPPAHTSFLDSLAQLFDFAFAQLRVGHAQHGGNGLLG